MVEHSMGLKGEHTNIILIFDYLTKKFNCYGINNLE